MDRKQEKTKKEKIPADAAGQRRKAWKQAVAAYLKSRRKAFFRAVFFALLALLFYRIGKIWRESFYFTLRFFYPISVMAALFQIVYFLPRWEFLKPRLRKALRKAGERLGPALRTLRAALRRIGRGFARFSNPFRKKTGSLPAKKKKKGGAAYRDEFLYAEGNGLFGRRRHHLRWRDMKTNQDKVRFYYMRYVLGAVKKGAPFSYHLTPEELKALWKNPEGAEPLTQLYYKARYGRKEIDEQELSRLEKE